MYVIMIIYLLDFLYYEIFFSFYMILNEVKLG